MYISANRPIHNHKLCDIRIFINSIENGSSSLRMTKHGKVGFVFQRCKDLLEKLEWKSFHSFFAPSRTAVAGTVDSNYVKLLQVWDSYEVFVEKISVGISWVFGAWAVDNKDEWLAWHASCYRIDVSISCGDYSWSYLKQFFSKVELFFVHFNYQRFKKASVL